MRVALLSIALSSIAAVFVAAGCSGARAEAGAACRERCGVEYMTCLEGAMCIDSLTGEMAPCERDCGQKRAACEARCGG